MMISSDPRVPAKYRKVFEPAWNPALGELKAGGVSPTEKFAISGYWANLLVFTPAHRRMPPHVGGRQRR
jgi:hypothetical protein